jgi:phosphoglycerate dehydrogenase-like enzyme
MPKVLITPTTLANRGGPHADLLRQAGFDLVFPSRLALLSEEELLRELEGVSASIAGTEPYTRRVFSARPSFRVVARAGVGYDTVDVAAATDHGVAVAITPGTNQDAVAEHTFALILALAKRVVSGHVETCAGRWPRFPTIPLRGQTLGIAGLGRIGKAVAVRGAAFQMPLLAYEPFPDQKFVSQLGIRLVSLEQLLKESDFLTIHVPLGPESKHLINRKTLALMKPTSFLINTARGGLVCEADLLEALQARKIAGAGLDVFEDEPALTNPLFQLDNVVVSPHAAGVDHRSLNDMAVAAASAIVNLSRGEWPAEQIVNPQVQTRFRW